VIGKRQNGLVNDAIRIAPDALSAETVSRLAAACGAGKEEDER
jgi:hypothetical protein